MQENAKNHRLWSVILAGGEGKRTRPFIRRWLGRHKPKQYCAFVGTRSMLQHTIDRADLLTLPDHRIIVTKNTHERHGWIQLSGRPAGLIVQQPSDRGTAAGIFLPLTYLRALDPAATVVVYPSDHFIYPEGPFLDIVRKAVSAAEDLPDHINLLATVPTRLESEYGWIWPDRVLGRASGCCVHAVQRFQEKPDPEEARDAMAAGALWNTFVFAAKAETLWRVGKRCLPEVMARFEQIGDAIGLAVEKAMIECMYETMPVRNFSRDLLMRASDQIAAIELNGVVWSDWGKPQRIADTLARLGIKPAFPLGAVQGA
jgi:mannose-1-phosphate guanylyltransferase